MTKIKVLELYSGIGGMHCALDEAGVEYEVVAAIDINVNNNQVYKHNFPGDKVLTKHIQSLSLKDFNKWQVDLVTMSPPCQPFTRSGCRQGLKAGSKDFRCQSFLYILSLLPKLQPLPRYLLLENVWGFETSDTCSLLLATLRQCGYTYRQFLLSPSQVGVPNSRLRYYLLAELLSCGGVSSSLPDQEISSSLPAHCQEISSTLPADCEEISSSLPADCNISSTDCQVSSTLPAADYEEISSTLNAEDEELELNLLPEKLYSTYLQVLDIVGPSSIRSCCFTRSYGRYLKGTGSLVETFSIGERSLTFNSYNPHAYHNKTPLQKMEDGRLRFFTPREVANIMCFPASYTYTDGSSDLTLSNGGAGINIILQDGTYIKIKEGARKISSNFTCELTAIWKALDVCLNQPSLHQAEGIIIYSDSRSALEAIQKGNTRIMQKIHSLLTQLETLEKNCILQWIPAHVVIGGNEMADELAKEARKLSQRKEQMSVFDADALAKYKIIKQKIRKDQICEINSERKLTKIIARLRTKHYKGMAIHPDGTRTYRACNNCPGVELAPTYIF
ncbi:TRDMT1 [Cordylochernes scorpioides]|uniref:TRDMT1 n=1 Tax=Cordylochernes scorpioides TaxID=51811 RepID=A0ABY6LJX9_9ARAC|nr:TRDMT1 [Cordylochernes scorpioides]